MKKHLVLIKVSTEEPETFTVEHDGKKFEAVRALIASRVHALLDFSSPAEWEVAISVKEVEE